MSSDYAPYKQSMRKGARELIKRITAHNGKLGFNWSVKNEAYEEAKEGSKQYPSKYKDFVAEAVRFLDSATMDAGFKDDTQLYKKHLIKFEKNISYIPLPMKMPTSFDMRPQPKEFDQLQVKGEEEKCDLRVKGPEVDPKLLMNAVEEAQSKFAIGVD